MLLAENAVLGKMRLDQRPDRRLGSPVAFGHRIEAGRQACSPHLIPERKRGSVSALAASARRLKNERSGNMGTSV
jgi:hypothetical protein